MKVTKSFLVGLLVLVGTFGIHAQLFCDDKEYIVLKKYTVPAGRTFESIFFITGRNAYGRAQGRICDFTEFEGHKEVKIHTSLWHRIKSVEVRETNGSWKIVTMDIDQNQARGSYELIITVGKDGGLWGELKRLN